jgi:hypothetical protein
MFVRFRQNCHRLQCSVVETRRVAGKVRHEHVGALGAIEVPPSVADRVAFWAGLHPRLFKLSNRVNGETQAKILGAVHARIPMPTADEQRQLQRENAESDERFWSGRRDHCVATAADLKGLAATTEHAIAENEAGAADASTKAAAARDRVERIDRGEDVQGGLGKPLTREDMERILLKAGLSRADIRHCYWLHGVFTELEKHAGAVDDFDAAMCKRRDAAEKRVRRLAFGDVLRKRGLRWGDPGDDEET